jgi:hypothetical protein
MSVRIFGKIQKILVVPVCHRCTPVIGCFSESRLLAIIGSPWPMTFTPTNEAIRHEISGKKDLIRQGKKIDRLAGLSHNRCKDRFLSRSVRLLRAGDCKKGYSTSYLLISIGCYSLDIYSFHFCSALNPDSSICMNCRYSPWLFALWALCFAEVCALQRIPS